MRRRCLNALVACALINGSAGVEGAVGAPDIDTCVSRLDPQLDIGYDRVAARCPELMHQLEGGSWAPWLPRGWKESGNDLSAGSLREFRELVDRESGAGNSSAAPDVRRLHAILTELARARSENGWTRFKSWLRSILERREEPTDESWLTRMVSHAGVSQSVIRLIAYAALTAVVLLAGLIVVNEARTAGLLATRRGAPRNRRELAGAGSSGAQWSDIERAQLGDRPRLLLELIVRRLSDRGFLPPAGALTVRELTRAARLPEADDRVRLTDLALAAERVRYSATGTPADALDEPVARGRELLERLDAGARDASAADASGPRAGKRGASASRARAPG